MAIRESEFVQPAEAGKAHSNLGPILDDICRLVQGSAEGALCSMVLRVGGEPPLVVAPGLPADALRQFQQRRVAEERLDGLPAQLAEPWGFESCITSPVLSSEGELLGVIALHYTGRHAETPSDRELLGSASRLAAAAIEHQQLRRSEAGYDSITGLLNRSRFITELDALVSAPEPGELTLLRINLDRFHHINDALGGAAGDGLLGEAGRRLARTLDPGDLAARIGADEFLVVLTKRAGEQSALRAAGDLLETLRAAYHVDGKELFLTASIGVAVFPKHGRCAWDLLRCGSLAMRGVKRRGGNGVNVFQRESSDSAVGRLELESALRLALERGELDLMYEPVVSAQGKADSFEALLTWRHPIRGVIPPSEFIPIAEESGLIAHIGSWVILEACLAGAGWRRAGFRKAHISLNVSAPQFEQDNFVDTLAVALAISGFPPECLELELTESCVVRDLDRSAGRMAQIRDLGVSIAIDDFGTGYSSLSYLHKLPVNCIKMDQSFLRGIAEVDGSLPVIQGIVRLARGMHLTVVAEGVETLEELELVRLAGCDKVQGHLFGPPLRAEEVEALLARDMQAAAL